MQSKGPTHLLLLFCDVQETALCFSTQRNSKAAASQIWLAGLQRLTGTASCSARVAALSLQLQTEPGASNMLHWGSQRARAVEVGVLDLGVIHFVPQVLGGGGVSRLYSLQAESKERFCISMRVCGTCSLRKILLGLSQHYRNTSSQVRK